MTWDRQQHIKTSVQNSTVKDGIFMHKPDHSRKPDIAPISWKKIFLSQIRICDHGMSSNYKTFLVFVLHIHMDHITQKTTRYIVIKDVLTATSFLFFICMIIFMQIYPNFIGKTRDIHAQTRLHEQTVFLPQTRISEWN